MNISNSSVAGAALWLRLSICMLTFSIAPVRVAIAQDVDAVERRLGAAVTEGEITLEQAAHHDPRTENNTSNTRDTCAVNITNANSTATTRMAW